MSTQGLPGPGGSLGLCIVCDKTFVMEILLGQSVQTVELPQFEGSFAVHKNCIEALQVARIEGWEALPEGKLRRTFGEAVEKMRCGECDE